MILIELTLCLVSPTDSADINTRLQLSDTSSIPPMHGGFLLRSAQFRYIRNCKMVLDSVACNIVSFSENHAFYCLLVHEEFPTIDMQSSPYWSNSKQLGPGHMLLPHWKLLFSIAITANNLSANVPILCQNVNMNITKIVHFYMFWEYWLCGALMLSFILAWISCWTNNQFSCYLRCHGEHVTLV